MDLTRLRRNVTEHERCPYCHDGMDQVARVECAGCGTPHHPACLAELGGCTVLGCTATPPAAPRGPTDEIRARIRRRAARYLENLAPPKETTKAVLRRLENQPVYCVACDRELLSKACPVCKGELLDECSGDSRHCASEQCRPFYAKLATQRGTPIQPLSLKARLSPLLIGALVAAGLLVLGLTAVLAALLGGSFETPFLLLAVIVGGLLVLFGPLKILMLAAKSED